MVTMRQAATSIKAGIRKRTRALPLEDGLGVPDERARAGCDAIGSEEVRVMRRLLDSLSARDREVLTRFYVCSRARSRYAPKWG